MHSHAIIIEGTHALHAANRHAKQLNCLAPAGEQEKDGGACTCLSCRVFDSGNHPDTLYVAGTKATGIGVDDVRDQVVRPMAVKPFRYTYKIFIIDKAETLTPQAQNALLKTIEEPAPYGVFLLATTQAQALLPTVLSRCALYKLPPGPAQPDHDEQALAAAVLAEDILNHTHRLSVLDALEMYARVAPFKEKRAAAHALLDALYIGYGAGLRTQPSWAACARAVLHTKDVLLQNGNFQLAMELLLLTLLARPQDMRC